MLIEATELRRSYWMGPTEVPALRGVDLEVERGELVAIMGPSGSGKSTLLHLLGCLDPPSGGRYRLDGVAVEQIEDAELSRIRNRKIGFVFQAFNLIPQHDVLENVELPLVYAGVARPLRRERSLAILREVGLESKVRHRPTELSGRRDAARRHRPRPRRRAAAPLRRRADREPRQQDGRGHHEALRRPAPA